MKKRTTRLQRTLIAGHLCACLSAAGSAQAADTNARDFYSAPAGTQLGVLYLPTVWANEFDSNAGTFKDAELDVNAIAYRHVWFSDICGTLCTPQFVVPASRVEATLPGASQSISSTGIGDPQVGGTLFLINNPEQREYSGLLTLLTLPVGSYDSDKADVSAGANRWGATFLLNYTRGVSANWTLEGSLEAQFYGDNDDYYGMTLSQDPLYRLQAFASYDFTPSTYGALRLYHAVGGELELDGQKIANTRQQYTDLGFELGHWLDPQNQLMFTYAKNVETENGFDVSQAMLRFVHVY
ncbi:QbdB [Marinobacterium lacunae]|uniref:QbdB n=1 Tax=Marinobacterium lacunae TaxID=1232683 RepID=A0A081G368_9GAMM|nr:transporter [Marinobacterium lacunae]KEA65223.1 QbdB [Marinobacterium lacunae]